MRNRLSAVDASVNQFIVPAVDNRRHPTESTDTNICVNKIHTHAVRLQDAVSLN